MIEQPAAFDVAQSMAGSDAVILPVVCCSLVMYDRGPLTVLLVTSLAPE